MKLRGFFSLDAFGTFYSHDFDSLDDLALYVVRYSHLATLLSITAAVGEPQAGPDFASWSEALASAAL
jgi:hypothetical protein